ncbi:Kelch domain-containing protein 1 [Anabarilius grahami]|uniref:Kelch domain-containing protein 1 n=1 Tax=Anabarilius grahami TaxID=495550 RepID=A0A3N0Z2L9_ANAGA|nr:Kelch domain-containing protein 1 [Anabarilius grahami]
MESTKEPAVVTAQCSPVPPRSDHISILEGHKLYVWGGCQCVDGQENLLPSDEIWLYDMEIGVWSQRHMGGEVPPVLSQTCGAYLQGILYIFGGCDNNDYTNLCMLPSLPQENYAHTPSHPPDLNENVIHQTWQPSTIAPSSSSDAHMLIYFGGYGPLRVDTAREVNNSKSFMVDEASWATIGSEYFQFWGWNNEVQMFEPESATWTEPQTQGQPPEPRASHASATLGHKGYICGGLNKGFKNTELTIHSRWLDPQNRIESSRTLPLSQTREQEMADEDEDGEPPESSSHPASAYIQLFENKERASGRLQLPLDQVKKETACGLFDERFFFGHNPPATFHPVEDRIHHAGMDGLLGNCATGCRVDEAFTMDDLVDSISADTSGLRCGHVQLRIVFITPVWTVC